MQGSLIFRRSASAIVDYTLFLAILVVYGYLTGNSPGWQGNPIVFVFKSLPGFFMCIFVWILYFPIFEAIFGFTLGKGLFDLKVVRERKNDFPFGVTLKRHLLDPIDFFMFGVPAILLVLVSEEHQRLGDRWARSRVLKEGDRIPTVSLPASGVPDPMSSIQYGGFWLRVGANLIDVLVLVPLGILSFFVLRAGNLWTIIPLQILGGLISAAYPTILHARYGATLGKMATGLSVRNTDLSRIGWREAALRSVVDYALILINTIGAILTVANLPKESLAQASLYDAGNILREYEAPVLAYCRTLLELWFWSEVVVLLFNKRKRALHDFIAGTVVVVNESLPQELRGTIPEKAT